MKESAADRVQATFLEGVNFFNQGSFFESHEVWEQLWRGARGTDRSFFQALIQTAAALYQVKRRNYVGAKRLWAKACNKLEKLPGIYLGIDLAALRAQMETFMRELGQTTRGQPREYPKLTVDF